jgi:hypothetical protein
MKTLVQEAPIVNTSTTPASEDTRSQLQHAVINHLNGLENAIIANTPGYPTSHCS